MALQYGMFFYAGSETLSLYLYRSSFHHAQRLSSAAGRTGRLERMRKPARVNCPL
jgi:hypothetical protein